MELYILRHGEAGKRIPAGGNDSQRALTVTGRQEVEEVADALSALDLNFNLIASSPLKRSIQTAQIVAKILKIKKGNVEEWGELKPEGNRAELYRRLGQFKQESSVLVVGHEPYLSNTISELVFGSATRGVVLKKSGIAKIVLIALQPKAKGELRWLLTPRQLKMLAK